MLGDPKEEVGAWGIAWGSTGELLGDPEEKLSGMQRRIPRGSRGELLGDPVEDLGAWEIARGSRGELLGDPQEDVGA